MRKINKFLNDISLDGEVWTEVPDWYGYWFSNMNRAASAKGFPKLLPTHLDKFSGDLYFNVKDENGGRRLYFCDITKKQEEPKTIPVEKNRKQKQEEQRYLSEAKAWALQLLGSEEHPDYQSYVDRLVDCASF